VKKRLEPYKKKTQKRQKSTYALMAIRRRYASY